MTDIMKDNWRVLDPRRSGRVTRYHTWPRIQQQSVGEHCWQLQRILLAIWPEVPRQVLIHAITHDVGEISTGDMPYPAKARDPELKKRMDDAEKSAHLRMSIPWSLPAPITLPMDVLAIFKFAEYIEMWEWSLDDLDLGNRNANLVKTRCWDALMAMREQIDTCVWANAMSYIARRLNLVDGGICDTKEDSNRHAFQAEESVQSGVTMDGTIDPKQYKWWADDRY